MLYIQGPFATELEILLGDYFRSTLNRFARTIGRLNHHVYTTKLHFITSCGTVEKHNGVANERSATKKTLAINRKLPTLD